MRQIERSRDRMTHMEHLRGAILDSRRRIKKECGMEADAWQKSFGGVHVLPGPGEYNSSRSLLTSVGGTWGHYIPKSDLEWQIIAATAKPVRRVITMEYYFM